jgi:hypothetical protein
MDSRTCITAPPPASHSFRPAATPWVSSIAQVVDAAKCKHAPLVAPDFQAIVTQVPQQFGHADDRGSATEWSNGSA